jgi:hypothetical protein
MEDDTLHDSSVSARRSFRVAGSLVIAAVLLVASQPAIAQETRAESIREQQAAKQGVVAPPASNRAEVIIDRLEDWGYFTGQPRGFYPWFGSVYPGGGFAAGAGVRKPFGDDGAVNVFGGYSIGSFWRGEADVALPTFAHNRARLSLLGRYVDARTSSVATGYGDLDRLSVARRYRGNTFVQ